MLAKSEITGTIIRVYEDGADPAGPYVAAIFVVGNVKVATLKGLRTASMNKAMWLAIAEELLRLGFHEAAWERHKDGKIIPIRFKIKMATLVVTEDGA